MFESKILEQCTDIALLASDKVMQIRIGKVWGLGGMYKWKSHFWLEGIFKTHFHSNEVSLSWQIVIDWCTLRLWGRKLFSINGLQTDRQTWRRRRTTPPWCEVCPSDKSGGRKETVRDSCQNKTPSAAHHSHHTPTGKKRKMEKQILIKTEPPPHPSQASMVTHLQYIFLWITCQQFSQSGVWELLQCTGTEAPLQTSDVHVDETLVRVLVDPAGQSLLHHGYLETHTL